MYRPCTDYPDGMPRKARIEYFASWRCLIHISPSAEGTRALPSIDPQNFCDFWTETDGLTVEPLNPQSHSGEGPRDDSTNVQTQGRGIRDWQADYVSWLYTLDNTALDSGGVLSSRTTARQYVELLR